MELAGIPLSSRDAHAARSSARIAAGLLIPLSLLLASLLCGCTATEAQAQKPVRPPAARQSVAAEIQQRIDAVFEAGGGTVTIPRGTTVLDKPLRLKSRVRLQGQGDQQSTLQLAPGVKADCVVESDGFTHAQGKNLWNYRTGKATGQQATHNEADGLHIGIVVEGLTIDGNHRGGAHAGGLHIYGGGFAVRDVGITDCDGHGLWTQCGRPDNSWAGDAEYRYANMHESEIIGLSVSSVTGHGVLFRGPNDSYMDRVQVKQAGGSAFSFEVGEHFGTGGLKIGTIHGYSCSGPRQIYFGTSGATANYIFCDNAPNEGVVIDGSGNLIDKIFAYHHNFQRKAATWGLTIHGDANYVGYYRYLTQQAADIADPQHGGALRVTGKFCDVPHGYLWGGSPGALRGEAVSGEKVFGGIVRDWE